MKEILYDWAGYNLKLFFAINHGHPSTLDSLLIWYSAVTNYHNFPYYFIAILVCFAISYLTRKARGRSTEKMYIKSWIGIFFVLLVGYAALVAAVFALKSHFGYPRPFVLLGDSAIRFVGEKPATEKYYASLPSGHMAFITFFVLAIWPKLRGAAHVLGVLCIAAVGYTRVAMGMHFPADIVYAFLLATIITLLVRRIIYGMFNIPYI